MALSLSASTFGLPCTRPLALASSNQRTQFLQAKYPLSPISSRAPAESVVALSYQVRKPAKINRKSTSCNALKWPSSLSELLNEIKRVFGPGEESSVPDGKLVLEGLDVVDTTNANLSLAVLLAKFSFETYTYNRSPWPQLYAQHYHDGKCDLAFTSEAFLNEYLPETLTFTSFSFTNVKPKHSAWGSYHVIFRVGASEVQSTDFGRASRSPAWKNQSLFLRFGNPDQSLEVSLYQHDLVDVDLVGVASIPLNEVQTGDLSKLVLKDGNNAVGTLQLSCERQRVAAVQEGINAEGAADDSGEIDWKKKLIAELESELASGKDLFKSSADEEKAWTELASILGFNFKSFDKICFVKEDITKSLLAVWKDATYKRLVVAFRGTNNPVNDLVDLSFVPIPTDTPGELVHNGFYITHELMLPAILPVIEHVVSDDKEGKWQVLVTGHSLGGALSTLLAKKLGETRTDRCDLALMNFGSPRVGNKTFKTNVNNVLPVSWRIVDDEDVVPDVPGGPDFFHIDRNCNTVPGKAYPKDQQLVSEEIELAKELITEGKMNPRVKMHLQDKYFSGLLQNTKTQINVE